MTPPPRRSPLLAVLIVLVAATVAAVAFGVTLILTGTSRWSRPQRTTASR